MEVFSTPDVLAVAMTKEPAAYLPPPRPMHPLDFRRPGDPQFFGLPSRGRGARRRPIGGRPVRGAARSAPPARSERWAVSSSPREGLAEEKSERAKWPQATWKKAPVLRKSMPKRVMAVACAEESHSPERASAEEKHRWGIRSDIEHQAGKVPL